MNIKFVSVDIKGFMSIVDESVKLENLGLAVLRGVNNYDKLFSSNGSGKSAIFDSILWCLTGYTSRGSSNVVNRYLHNKSTSVTLTFNIDSDNYKLTRTDGSSKSLKIIKNDEDISGSTFTKSKQILKDELMFINYDVLTSIIILSQGLPGRLSSLSPSARKSRLEYLSSIDEVLDKVQNKVQLVYSDISGKLSELNTTRTKVSSVIDSNNVTISNLQHKIDDISSSKSKLSTDYTQDELEKKISEINKVIEIFQKKLNDLRNLRSEFSVIISSNTNIANNLKGQIDKLNIDINQLVNNKCPTCGQSLPNNDLYNKYVNDLKEISDKYDEVNRVLINANNELSKLPNTDYFTNQIEENNKLIQIYSQDLRIYDKINASVDSLKSAIIECSSIIDNSKKDLSEVVSHISEFESKFKIIDYLKSVISRKFRNYLLDGIIEFLNTRLSYYSKYLFTDKVVYLQTTNSNNLEIHLSDSMIEDCSGGESRRIDLILQLALRDLSKVNSGFTCNLLVLDEVLDYLDNDGISNVITMIEDESSYIDTLILITHKNDLSIPYDSEIVIVKDENQLSYISK